ncbi:hypothetical protein AVEN_29323-1 [Araneus ventricosus]|uniref:Uncharacterized protein n=1 Tax=Araneus ventricosus TaxID=182803 RepID=A0A4Y2IY52_ARAVE|nr:hypothetical protein AVEN_29323-1 [Araneus ventricosus]
MIAVTVTPHATLNSSKGVISFGDLLNDPIEKITKKLSNQGVTHVRRITIRRDGQLLNTKYLILLSVLKNYMNTLKQDLCSFLSGHIFQTHCAVLTANVTAILNLPAAGH